MKEEKGKNDLSLLTKTTKSHQTRNNKFVFKTTADLAQTLINKKDTSLEKNRLKIYRKKRKRNVRMKMKKKMMMVPRAATKLIKLSPVGENDETNFSITKNGEFISLF